jgi:hypothetical protein
MARRLEEITATILHERLRFGEGAPFTVILDGAVEGAANGSARVALKGETRGEGDQEEPRQFGAYHFYGRWDSYTNRRTGETEQQFRWDTFTAAEPHSRAGVIAYLEQAPNVGRVLAGRLFDKFGSDAVKVLREHPEAAAAACDRLSPEAAKEASEYLEQKKALENCSIELIGLLNGRGFPKSLAEHAVKEFGNRAAEVIKGDPYKLMRFRGAGFKRCDSLYLELGHPRAKLKRQAYCATHAITQAISASGDTWIYRQVADVGLAGSIGGAEVRADHALQLANRGGILSVEHTAGTNGPIDFVDGDTVWLSDARKARSEIRLADYVCEALREAES